MKRLIRCAFCGTLFERGKTRGPAPVYCKPSCRQRAFEARRRQRTQVGWWEPSRVLTGNFTKRDGEHSTTYTLPARLIPMTTTEPVADTWKPVYVDGLVGA